MQGTMYRFAFSVLSAALLCSAPAWAKTAANQQHPGVLRWPAENLSGQIDMVLPAQHLVVVKDSTGTTYDFVVTHGTQIEDNGSHTRLPDLESKVNAPVTVHFVPESTGDIARTIRLGQ